MRDIVKSVATKRKEKVARRLVAQFVLVISFVWTGAAKAEVKESSQEELRQETKRGFELSIGGYGEFQFAYFDYGPDQTLEGGSASGGRTVFDLTRFSLGMKGQMTEGLEFEAELEIEHGGTGSALELEYEEFGEYESEVEKGGEVVLEELYLEKTIGENLSVMLGRFYVALGLLSTYHKPTQYLGSDRPESETRVIPAVWDEMGIEAHYKTSSYRLTLQVINGLDSTGFSSQRWISSGHQKRFELVRATGGAFVGRIDITHFKNIVFGASSYFSPNTNSNRPKSDMEGISAPLLLASAHFALDRGPFRARCSVICGHLWKAETISVKNKRLSNNLGVLRTPVAQEAISFWSEFGIDILYAIQRVASIHRLETFLRFERYDTMFRTGTNTFNNPRFKRSLFSIGGNYTYSELVVMKLDWTHRRLGSSRFRNENTLRLSAGFVF